MTKIYTIGSNGKTAKVFFELLKTNHIRLLIDIRLNNNSQLTGFSKGGIDNLGYLLKEIGSIGYVHDTYFSPTKEILDSYHETRDWDKYTQSFCKLMSVRDIKTYFFNNYGSSDNICLLCTEEKPEKCHRRLLSEYLFDKKDIIHL